MDDQGQKDILFIHQQDKEGTAILQSYDFVHYDSLCCMPTSEEIVFSSWTPKQSGDWCDRKFFQANLIYIIIY